MEVIYYMRNYYPLTAAQKMHHNWITGLWYTAGIWRKRCGFCTGRTGFWIIEEMYSDGNGAFRLYQSPFYESRIKREM